MESKKQENNIFQESLADFREVNIKNIDKFFSFFCDFIIEYFNDYSKERSTWFNRIINWTSNEVEEILFDEVDLRNASRQERKRIKNTIKNWKHKKVFMQIKQDIETTIYKYNLGLDRLKNSDWKFNIWELIKYSLIHFDKEDFEDWIDEMKKMTSKIIELLSYLIINNIKWDIAYSILEKNWIKHSWNFDIEKINSAITTICIYGDEKIKSRKETSQELKEKKELYKASLIRISKENEKIEKDRKKIEDEYLFTKKSLQEILEKHKTLQQQLNLIRKSNEKLSNELTKANNQITNLTKENELLKNWKLTNNDNWEEIASELDLEIHWLKQEKNELWETIEKQLKQIKILESKVNFLLQNWVDEIKYLRFKVENELENCNIDDLISYITYSNFSIIIKQELVEIISKFLSQISQDVTKWAASSTNINASNQKKEWAWTWSWCYANKFINPLINFLEQKKINYWTIWFLEYITELNLIEFIKEYKSWEVLSVSNKKDSVMLKIFNSINEKWLNEVKWLYKSFEMIAKVFENINHWDLDLSLLSEKIKKSLESKNIKKELELLLIKVR